MDLIIEVSHCLSDSTRQIHGKIKNFFDLRIRGVYILCFIFLFMLLIPKDLFAKEID